MTRERMNDVTREVRNYHRREVFKRDAARMVAFVGVTALAVNVGIAFGNLIFDGWNPFSLFAITVWGAVGMTYLATRH